MALCPDISAGDMIICEHYLLYRVSCLCFFFCCTVYDVSGGSGDRNCVVLNDIHIDIMDYIVPASCTDSEFRQMWAEFEWENKVKSPKSPNTIQCKHIHMIVNSYSFGYVR